MYVKAYHFRMIILTVYETNISNVRLKQVSSFEAVKLIKLPLFIYQTYKIQFFFKINLQMIPVNEHLFSHSTKL